MELGAAAFPRASLPAMASHQGLHFLGAVLGSVGQQPCAPPQAWLPCAECAAAPWKTADWSTLITNEDDKW